MARLNLIQVIACRAKIAAKNFNLRGEIDGVISSLTKSATNFVSSIVTNIQGQASDLVDQMIAEGRSAENALRNIAASIENQFQASVTTINDRLNQIKGVFETTCLEADTADPQRPKVNVIAEIASLPLTNDPVMVKSSSDAQNHKNLSDAKTQTVLQLATVIGNINGQLSTKSPSEIREQVRQLKEQNPILNQYVATLSYFQPISESVGASFLIAGYTPDKPDLLLNNWGTPTAAQRAYAIRRNINPKVRSEIATEIESHYTALNNRLYTNISQEFIAESTVAPMANYPDAYHLKGDNHWHSDLMISNDIPAIVLAKMNASDPNFKNNVSMVNYLVPIQEQITISNDTYDTMVEGQSIIVDKRNNKVVNPTNGVNNNALKPVKALEV